MSFAPTYGTFEYFRWRQHVSPHDLQPLVDITDALQVQILRGLLEQTSYSWGIDRLSAHELLDRLAQQIQSGQVVIFDHPSRSSSLHHWLCRAEDVRWKTIRGPEAVAGATIAHTPPEEPAAPRTAPVRDPETRDIVIDLIDEHQRNLGNHLSVKNGTRYKLVTDKRETREGTVQNGRIEEKAVEIASTFTLEFVAPV